MSKEGVELINKGIRVEVREGIANTFDLVDKMVDTYIRMYREIKEENKENDNKSAFSRAMCDASIETLKMLKGKFQNAKEELLR